MRTPEDTDPVAARSELAYLRSVLERTQRRVDPHAFHFVSWGAVVLVWYPTQNLLELGDAGPWRGIAGLGFLLLGTALSAIGEWRLQRRLKSGELPPEDESAARQVLQAVWGPLGAALLLTIAGPALGLFDPKVMPIVWGLAYAVLAWGVGVVYSAEFLWGGVAIFAGCLAAYAATDYAGLILGPAMGFGLGIPGLVAMRRVRASDVRRAAGGVA